MNVVYPGSFDPVTYGHLDLIKRATKIFDRVIVAVAENRDKSALFSVEERVQMLKKAVSDMDKVTVDAFECLTVKYVKSKEANVIIRGIRMVTDFEYEFQMALTNRRFAPDIETIFMMPAESYSYLSSKLIKEAAFLDADLNCFIPPFVSKILKEKLSKDKK